MGIAKVIAIPYFCIRMDETHLLELMEHHGVKPTANRIVIARALAAAGRPMSMTERETVVETIDKSNIFSTLQAFREARLVHVLDDSGDGVRYELCHSHHDDEDDDVHVHFYCEKCHRTFCLEDTPVPPVSIPDEYAVHSVSYLIKGLCKECQLPTVRCRQIFDHQGSEGKAKGRRDGD